MNVAGGDRVGQVCDGGVPEAACLIWGLAPRFTQAPAGGGGDRDTVRTDSEREANGALGESCF